MVGFNIGFLFAFSFPVLLKTLNTGIPAV